MIKATGTRQELTETSNKCFKQSAHYFLRGLEIKWQLILEKLKAKP